MGEVVTQLDGPSETRAVWELAAVYKVYQDVALKAHFGLKDAVYGVEKGHPAWFARLEVG